MGNYANDERAQCMGMALKKHLIECIEKQIPKKPEYVDIRWRNHSPNISDGSSLCKCYKCPTCKSHIFKTFDDHIYCPKCGQMLDWSE